MFKVEKEWTSPKGYPCAVIFTRLGHRCGYVGVPVEHPLFEIHYNDIDNIEAHGGLTFSDVGGLNYPSSMFTDHWVFGFDCAHFYDSPDYESAKRYGMDVYHFSSTMGGHVWTHREVEVETNALAKQLEALA